MANSQSSILLFDFLCFFLAFCLLVAWGFAAIKAINSNTEELVRLRRQLSAMDEELQAISLHAEQHQLDIETMLMLWDK